MITPLCDLQIINAIFVFFCYRDLRPASLEKGQEIIRLRFYAAYAWGGPLIIAGLAALVDHLPNVKDQTFLRPRFGEKQCWFYGKFLSVLRNSLRVRIKQFWYLKLITFLEIR